MSRSNENCHALKPFVEWPSHSPTSFPITLTNGAVIATFGEAGEYLAKLPMEKRLWSRWKVAIDLLDKAMKDLGYLKAATMSLQPACCSMAAYPTSTRTQ